MQFLLIRLKLDTVSTGYSKCSMIHHITHFSSIAIYLQLVI